jgi:4-amino-4-deoxy-L-arabinose transferase-like glycosyltransferase
MLLGWLSLAAVAAVAIRLPLLGVPLDADEGGYAYLARRWAGGSRLYGPAWVDRPQGLLVSYRLVTDLGRSRVWIHLAAIGLAVLLLLAVASAGWALAGRRAAILGAVLVAVPGAAPHLQGFMFNGELAAGAFSACAVAGAAWYARVHADWLLVLAGGCSAIALLMKQSGFDGLAVALVCAVVFGRIRGVGAVLLGAAGPFGLAVVHAAVTGWSDWWFAVIGYRLHTSAGSRGGLAGRWHNLTTGLPHLWPDLLPLGLLGVAGLAVCLLPGSRPGRPAPTWLAPAWLLLAFAGFFGGVFFFPHYWMQLVGPLCLLGAIALAALPVRAALRLLVVGLLLVACLPSVLWTVRASVASPDRRDRLAVPDRRLLANRDISPWLRAHAARTDQLYAFVSSADLYYTSGLHTDFRYLWQANLEAIPAALGELRGYLAGPDRPQWIVLYQQPSMIDPSGAIEQTLAADYGLATVIDGYRILHSR